MDSENLTENIENEFGKLDICGCSLLHHLFTRPPVQKETFLKTYFMPWFITAFLFYGIPLIIVLLMVPHNLRRDANLGLKVGFLNDWNVMFMYLVTLPLLVIFALSERSMVPRRIASIISGSATYRGEKVSEFVSTWNKRYKMVNVFGQLGGVLVAFAVAFANYKSVLTLEGYTGWGGDDGKVNAAGWVYLCWQIPLFYWIVSVYASQGLATIALLFSLTKNFKIRIWPFHYDNCCGLRAVGYIGIRNQYLLAVVGLNLLALLAVNIERGDARTIPLLVAGFVAYITLGPVIFIGPLLPFRKSMLSAKQAEQAKVATQLQNEYTRIMQELEERSMAKKDEEMIDRLQKLKELVNQIPVWPFDISTLRRFLTVYIFPLLTAVVSILISYLIKAIGAMYAT
ncbi:MAG: hypothetical protein GWN67_25600 [Phycisphaerae bacterium]|nr:YlbF family regulator [Phycisphaerae bacterium]NIP52571.1 YlbF family regulator [Phycisphaerae bacterium]NIS51555.1 YlbF family regulator [Phycisphaerae bacterium]NIU09137.1 YlbF family regulator [Phycisphaerae bacterium]NIU59637.1 hypothetical protein [Phycisphaerae bacterium]